MTDPTDETQPHPTAPSPATPAAPVQPVGPAEPSTPAPPSTPPPPSTKDSGWREPPWFPPRDQDRRARDRQDRRPSPVAIVVGLALIAIGLYYFLDRTLGIALPRISWGSLWPVVLIVIGGLILLRSFERKA